MCAYSGTFPVCGGSGGVSVHVWCVCAWFLGLSGGGGQGGALDEDQISSHRCLLKPQRQHREGEVEGRKGGISQWKAEKNFPSCSHFLTVLLCTTYLASLSLFSHL